MRQSTSITRLAVVAILLSSLYWLVKLTELHSVSSQIANQKTSDVRHHQERPGRSGSHDTSIRYAPQRQDYPDHFPRKIWQTSSQASRERWAEQIKTWTSIKQYEYTFLSDETAKQFVHHHFKDRPSILAFWDQLQLKVLRADLLRYLIMLAEGGIYSDIDTSVLQHPDSWISSALSDNSINAVIGIEYDDSVLPTFSRLISFCQWTLMSKPNHPIFELAVQRTMSNLEYVSRRQGKSISGLELSMREVLDATGPGMVTDVVMQVLRDQGENVTHQTFHNMTQPKLFGDVLILPINGFAGHQKHSHSGDPAYGNLYVKHHYAASWYEKPGDRERVVDGT